MGKYILEDLSRSPEDGGLQNSALARIANPKGKWLGHAMCVTPLELQLSLDYTGPVGAASSVYYSLVFQVGKWEYNGVMKADEWIEISPVHSAYYQLTMKQREELEGRIKAGLASVSQAVADYELLLHDKRKYEEMVHYLGYDADGEGNLKEDKKDRKPVDNHSLKAMFIDQVDFHTGDGISMRSIVSRWPTLISDFMKLDDADIDPDKVKTKLDVSRAEAVILVTKNKLYLEWKRIFLPDVLERYKRIMTLVRSRGKSVEEYKNWLEPFIARHKLINEGLSRRGNREFAAATPYSTSGHPVSSHKIVLWIWKDFATPEIYKTPSEIHAQKPVQPDDDWTMRNLIFGDAYGLINKYPWITKEWVQEKKDEFQGNRWLPPNKMYYSFFIITFMRNLFRTPQGEEFEDGEFNVNLVVASQNVMFVKLLELAAKQEEFNRYVDEMLGIPMKIKGGADRLKPRKQTHENAVTKVFHDLNIPLTFIKRGPYERDFDDRITKFILQPIGADRYAPMINFLKSKIGYGQ